MRAFYDSVFNGEIKTSDFCDIFEDFMKTEDTIQMWDFTFELMLEALTKFTPRDIYNEVANKVYEILKRKIEESNSIDDKTFLVIELIKYATNADKAQYLVDWLLGKNKALPFEPTMAQTWKITEMICAYKERYGDHIEEALKMCEERDQTDSKIPNRLKLEALSADEDQRKKLLEIYMSGKHDWGVEELRNSLSGFTSKHIKTEIKEKYIEYFFDNLIETLRRYPQTYANVSNFLKILL